MVIKHLSIILFGPFILISDIFIETGEGFFDGDQFSLKRISGFVVHIGDNILSSPGIDILFLLFGQSGLVHRFFESSESELVGVDQSAGLGGNVTHLP